MLLEPLNDIIDIDVADDSPQLGSTDRRLVAASQRGSCSRLILDVTDDEEDLRSYDATESADVSSDPPHAQEDGSVVEDVHANSSAAGKRKASPVCVEDAGPQKKARTETDGQELTDSDTPDATTEPRQCLDPDQKNYLAGELTTM